MEGLSGRKRKILQVLVDDYIDTAQPVSSKDIQFKLMDCSSATIRNEMSALTSMGYLVQPHTSSGRVPSNKAFRFYVDQLMIPRKLNKRDTDIIVKQFTTKLNSIEDVVANVAKVLSEITNYTSVIVKNSTADEVVKRISIVDIGGGQALVVVVTDCNIYKDNIINISEMVDDNIIAGAVNWMNKLFVGATLSEFANPVVPLSAVFNEFEQFNQLYLKVVGVLRKVSNIKDTDVFTQGVNKIFSYPEYSDIGKAREFVTKLEQKNNLAELFLSDNIESQLNGNLEFNIKIGSEDDDQLPQGCSIVSAKISIKDKTLGTAGIIGPTRMDYNKVISVLDLISKLADDILIDEEDDK